MSERVYPQDSPPVSGEYSNNVKPIIETPPVSGEHQRRMSQDSFASSKMSYDHGHGYTPNPGTYVVQVPKDQIYRIPPPENAHKYNLYTKKKTRRNRCRCCICSILATILILVILLAIAIGVIFLIYNPKLPSYTIQSVHVKGMNLTPSTTTSRTISPIFNVTVKTENRNRKIGIYYEQGSEVNIYHDEVNLCEGELPTFYQPPNSITTFSTKLNGAGIVLSKSAYNKFITEQKNGKVRLEMDFTVPVKIKLGTVKSWKFTVKVSCEITVKTLTINAKVMSKSCKVNVKPW